MQPASRQRNGKGMDMYEQPRPTCCVPSGRMATQPPPLLPLNSTQSRWVSCVAKRHKRLSSMQQVGQVVQQGTQSTLSRSHPLVRPCSCSCCGNCVDAHAMYVTRHPPKYTPLEVKASFVCSTSSAHTCQKAHHPVQAAPLSHTSHLLQYSHAVLGCWRCLCGYASQSMAPR
jgi:hypothetical protein